MKGTCLLLSDLPAVLSQAVSACGGPLGQAALKVFSGTNFRFFSPTKLNVNLMELEFRSEPLAFSANNEVSLPPTQLLVYLLKKVGLCWTLTFFRTREFIYLHIQFLLRHNYKETLTTILI